MHREGRPHRQLASLLLRCWILEKTQQNCQAGAAKAMLMPMAIQSSSQAGAAKAMFFGWPQVGNELAEDGKGGIEQQVPPSLCAFVAWVCSAAAITWSLCLCLWL